MGNKLLGFLCLIATTSASAEDTISRQMGYPLDADNWSEEQIRGYERRCYQAIFELERDAIAAAERIGLTELGDLYLVRAESGPKRETRVVRPDGFPETQVTLSCRYMLATNARTAYFNEDNTTTRVAKKKAEALEACAKDQDALITDRPGLIRSHIRSLVRLPFTRHRCQVEYLELVRE